MDVTKRCPRCGKEKPVEDFVRNRSAKDGLGSYCKPCHNRVIKEQKQKLYGGERSFLLMLRYGISEVEFEQLRKRQRGMCAICRKRAAKHVDHDHESGRVRAILCFYCNRGLGKFRDNPALIRKAKTYLATER